MADEVTEPAAQTAGEAGSSTNAGGTGGATATQTAGEGQNTGERNFTQAELDRKVNERLAEERKRQEKRDAEAEAKRRGDFEQLLSAKERELEETRAELAQERHNVLKARIAAKHSLPPELAERLQGQDEAALEADAKHLAKFAPKANGLPPASGRNPAQGSGDLSPEKTREQLRAHRGYGI